jgi:polyphosphate kinase
MVRVSSLIDRKIAGSVSKDPAGLSVKQQLSAISARVHEMAQKQYNCLNRSLLPFLDSEKINILTYKELSKAQKTFVRTTMTQRYSLSLHQWLLTKVDHSLF